MSRELTPEEIEVERKAELEAAKEAAYDKAHVSLLRQIALSYTNGIGYSGALFLARAIIEAIAKTKLPGNAPAEILHAVNIARAGSAAMQAALNRRSARAASDADNVIELPRPHVAETDGVPPPGRSG